MLEYDLAQFNPRRANEPRLAAVRGSVEIAVTAYSDECVVVGRLVLAAGRLTDHLNELSRVVLYDVVATALDDGRSIPMGELSVERDEVVAVSVAGPPGSLDQRVSTRRHPVTLQTGPYRIWGYIHTLPGVDPLASLRHRSPMVPLTDAAIEYTLASQPRRDRLAGVIVNRDLAESLAQAEESELQRQGGLTRRRAERDRGT